MGTDALAGPMSGIYARGANDVGLDGSAAGAQTAAEYVRDRLEVLTANAGDNSIVGTTADAVSELVEQALERGWSEYTLARAIERDTAFSLERAELIAETELSAAEYAGALAGMRAGGVRFKAWFVDEDAHEKDDDCDDNVDDGDIEIDEPFSTGDMAPPAHPRCACYILAVSGENEGEPE